MIRSSRLFLISVVATTTLAGASHAQNASSAQPSIEMNQDVLRTLQDSSGAPAQPSAPHRAYENVYEPITIDGANSSPINPTINPDSRTTTITPGKPHLVWVKGLDGQIVEMKPDPKPRKKKVKKAAPKEEDKQCPCPEEAAKAAPVEPVKTEEPKKEESVAAPAPTPTPTPEPTPAPAPAPAPVPAPMAEPAPVAPTVPEPTAASTPPPAPPAPPAAVAPPPAPPAPVEATPPAPPVAAPAPAAPEAAAAPVAPAAPAGDGKPTDLTISFKATETALPLTTKEQMDTLVAKLKADETLRVNLVAYASAAPDQANTARRVSLSRALSVRAYLIDNGISNLRINVQAEGEKNPGGEADRVDVFVTK